MGFWSTLAGAGIGFLTGGPVGAVIGGVSGFQADRSANAEKKAAEQQQDAYMRGIQAYQPFHTLGLQGANSLAQALGLEGLPAGAMGGEMSLGRAVPRDAGPSRIARAPMGTLPHGNTLASVLNRPQIVDETVRPLPSGSQRGRTLSSYRSVS